MSFKPEQNIHEYNYLFISFVFIYILESFQPLSVLVKFKYSTDAKLSDSK